jgi:Uma2 family endonuclease
LTGTIAGIKNVSRCPFVPHRNGFAPDLVALAKNAEKNEEGSWQSEDIEFLAEVIAEMTAPDDYGKKKQAYVLAEVPLFLIADPYAGECHLFTQPEKGEYQSELTVAFGKRST